MPNSEMYGVQQCVDVPGRWNRIIFRDPPSVRSCMRTRTPPCARYTAENDNKSARTEWYTVLSSRQTCDNYDDYDDGDDDDDDMPGDIFLFHVRTGTGCGAKRRI